MKSFKSALLAAAALVSISCSQKTIIEGYVSGISSEKLAVHRIKVYGSELADSIATDSEGRFRKTFSIEGNKPEFLCLYRGDTKLAEVIAGRGERIKIESDTLGNWSVEGSTESVLLRQVERDWNAFLASASECGSMEELSKLYIEYYRGRVSYIISNPYSLTQIRVLTQAMAPGAPIFAQPSDALFFRRACDSLKTVYPDSPYVKFLEKEAKDRENRFELERKFANATEIGFPDIVMPGLDGENVALSGVSAKVVLLHFWTASDVSNKMFNLDVLKPLYEKYHGKGLEIYSVCIDYDKPRWAGVVSAQRLPWINVCDGLGAASPSLRTYAVDTLPSSFLISGGEIASKTVSGEAGLRRELARLLSY